MKKLFLIIGILLVAVVIIATKWSEYGDLGSGNIIDANTLMVLDTDDPTLAATGTQKQWLWSDVKIDMNRASREFSNLAFDNGDTNTEFTIANMIHYKGFSNYGAGEETDIYLDNPAYRTLVVFTVSESYITEICPPSGELFVFDGTTLDADDCIDTSAVPGSTLSFLRVQITAGAWRWFAFSVTGAHVDTGATD